MSRRTPSVIVKPDGIEGSRGYILRTCMVNGWPTQSDLLRRIGVTAQSLMAKVDPEELSSAFGLLGGDFALLRDRWSHDHVEVGKERLRRDRIDKRRRICPECVAQTSSSRLEWDFRFISECPQHGALTGSCACGQPLGWQDRNLAICRKCSAIPNNERDRPTQPPGNYPFQIYATSRLGQGNAVLSSILDPLPLEMVLGLVEGLGQILTDGFSILQPKTSDDKMQIDAAEVGYAWLTGSDRENTLVAIVAGFRESTGITCPKEPLRALGWTADLAAFFVPYAPDFLDLMKRRLGLALGYPIHDLWHTDFWEVARCAETTRLTESDFVRVLTENGWSRQCHAGANGLFVPIDILWRVRQLAAKS